MAARRNPPAHKRTISSTNCCSRLPGCPLFSFCFPFYPRSMIAMVVCSPFVRHSQYHATRSLYTSSTTQFCRTTPLRVTISLHPWASFSSVHLFTTRYNPRVPVSSPPSAPGVNSLSVPELLLLLRGDSRCRRQHSLSDCLPTDLASMSSDCFSTTAKTERLPLL